MASYKIELTDDEIKTVLDLAEKRGVDANTIVKQAIGTERLIADNVGKDDDLVIRRGDNSVAKFTFANS